jgi:3-oxoacyl-[acyl-carrier protein] reductase
MPGSVLVTGVSRSIGIGAAIARSLAADGWTVVTAGHVDYDARMPWGADASGPPELGAIHLEADLADPEGPARLIDAAAAEVGQLTGLVMCHCESVDSAILDTTVDSFDRHFAVNARATWLLVKEFAQQFPAPADDSMDRDRPGGRIVAITSDHTPFNLPYGASKAALDRIVIAAATELAHLEITANVINPGATDTGWMTPEITEAVLERNLQPRVGLPQDCANLVRWLCSDEGQWVNGQLLHSDGGLSPR